MKNEGIALLITSRMNQDGLENLFSTIRLMGGSNSHPTARDFANRIRTLCLTKNITLVVSGPSVELTDTDEFMSTILVDEATKNQLVDHQMTEQILFKGILLNNFLCY